MSIKHTFSLCLFLTRVSNRTWTRTVNLNEPFHFGEPEPNLNQQNFTSVNLNQTWTLKIVLKWTQTEPEPLTIFPYPEAAGAGTRTIRAVVIINKISNFSFFFLDETSNDS